ncbi:hypothetical protein AGLY_014903 [Aphis glycines]|uniref:Uncharacterized protein n=1 Tax=Aphis glycines TaxID=307491 RepID=A0A6G0T2I9_APHGL|nr:hypothetical protein AGLY_014903 [Aphis glycines]
MVVIQKLIIFKFLRNLSKSQKFAIFFQVAIEKTRSIIIGKMLMIHTEPNVQQSGTHLRAFLKLILMSINSQTYSFSSTFYSSMVYLDVNINYPLRIVLAFLRKLERNALLNSSKDTCLEGDTSTASLDNNLFILPMSQYFIYVSHFNLNVYVKFEFNDKFFSTKNVFNIHSIEIHNNIILVYEIKLCNINYYNELIDFISITKLMTSMFSVYKYYMCCIHRLILSKVLNYDLIY